MAKQTQEQPTGELKAGGETQKKASYRVAIPFQDAPEYVAYGKEAKTYAAGETLPADFDSNRTAAMLKRGIVEAV